MIKIKRYIEIKEHCTKLKIKGWESQKNARNIGSENISMVYSGVADGKKFRIQTNGRTLLGDVIDKICKAVET